MFADKERKSRMPATFPKEFVVSGLNELRVTVRAKDTGAARTVTTDAAGLFDALNLTPGDYSIEIEAPGFSALTRQVTLEVGQNMGLDFTLTVGAQHEATTVTAAAETLQTQDVAIGEVVDQRAVQD